MIGAPQVIGTKPMVSSFFSGGPAFSSASALAAPKGNRFESEESTAPAPTAFKSSRRVLTAGNTLRKTAFSTCRSIVDSAESAALCAASFDVSLDANPRCLRRRWRRHAPGFSDARARPKGAGTERLADDSLKPDPYVAGRPIFPSMAGLETPPRPPRAHFQAPERE